MITKLILTNFKKHKSLEMSFTSGLNILIGNNYAGKSSILHGINFALGGYSAVPGGKAVAVNDEAKEAAAELFWSMGSSEFHVKRRGANATLSRDGEEIAKGATPVAAELAKLFGMPSRRFMQLKYSAQKQTESLLTLGVTELHRIIEEISGADVVTKVAEACKAVESECTGGLESLPEGDVPALKQANADLRASLAAKKIALDEQKARKQAKDADLNLLRSQLDKANAFNGEQGLLAAEISRLKALQEAQISAASEAEERRGASKWGADAVLKLTNEAADLQQEVNEIESSAKAYELVKQQVATLSVKVKGLNEKREAANSDAANMTEVAQDIERNMPQHLTDLQSARDVLATLKSEMTHLKHAITGNVCPTCKRALSEDVDVGEMQEKLAAVETQASEQAKTVSTLQDGLDRAKADLARALSILNIETAADAAYEAAKAELVNAEIGLAGFGAVKDAASLKEALKALNIKVHNAGTAAAIFTAATNQVERAAAEIKALDEKLAELPEPQDLLPTEPLMNRIKEEAEALHQLDILISAGDEAYRNTYGQWSRVDAELKAAIKAEQKRAELTARKGNAKGLKKFLLDNRDRYLATVWDGVMTQASSFASACTGGWISQVVRNGNGSFAYVEDGVERPIDAASGAQRSILGLGVQLALDTLLPCPWQTLLLDEVTADADPAHSLAMATMLAATGRQMLMVSHREVDGAVADNVVEVV